ncbi:MAG: DUF695 domain-containing protein [Planctomycetes bacterium]|nr:DUF695 domain-containing protein [Planctomycetota bacterium]
MGLIKNIFQKKGERFPKSNLVTFVIQRDDVATPIVGSVDTAYRDYPYKTEVPWLLNITVKMEKDNGVGGPTDKESEILNRFEDFLIHTKRFRTLARIHWIGRLTYGGVRDLMMYMDNPEPIHAYLQEIIEKEDHLRSFEYEIVKDVSWESLGAILSDIDKRGAIMCDESDSKDGE